MQKCNANEAIKLYSENIHNRILPLNEETRRLLIIKHPEASPAAEEVLLKGKPEDKIKLEVAPDTQDWIQMDGEGSKHQLILEQVEATTENYLQI